jgi:hypothetical protein
MGRMKTTNAILHEHCFSIVLSGLQILDVFFFPEINFWAIFTLSLSGQEAVVAVKADDAFDQTAWQIEKGDEL